MFAEPAVTNVATARAAASTQLYYFLVLIRRVGAVRTHW